VAPRFHHLRYEINYTPFCFLLLDDIDKKGWSELPPHGWFQRSVGAWLLIRRPSADARDRTQWVPDQFDRALLLAPGASIDLDMRIKHVSAPTYWRGDSRLLCAAVPTVEVERSRFPLRGVIDLASWHAIVEANDHEAELALHLQENGGDEWGEKKRVTLTIGKNEGGPWMLYCGVEGIDQVKDLVSIISVDLRSSRHGLTLVDRALDHQDSETTEAVAIELAKLFGR
jgi:hypothetical protein